MSDDTGAKGASAFIPAVWSESYRDMVSGPETAIQRLWRNERECQWHEDWIRVETPDGESFRAGRDDVKVVLLDDGTFELQGSKVVTRSVPDVAAQDDLQALLDKWRAEGKGSLADAVEEYGGDGCGCCDYGGNVFGALETSVAETVERRAKVEDCTFYAAQSGTISIPRLANIEVRTHDYKAIEAAEPDE